MEKWLSNSLQINTYNLIPDGNLKELLNQPIQYRPHFSNDSHNITIPRYFIRLIGLSGEEDVYYNSLHEIHTQLKRNEQLYLPLLNGCHETIEKNLLRELNIMWSKLLNFAEINSGIVIQMLDNSKLLLNFPNEILSKQIRTYLRIVIEHYFELNNNSVDPNDFKQLIFYLVYWINLYFEPLFLTFDYRNINPKVLYYGDISKEEIFFLLFLSLLGSDILYINPLRNCEFDSIDKHGRYTVKQEFPSKGSIQPFPTEKRATRVETLTRHASKEIEQQLGETNAFFKSWQLTEYKPASVTLKTTHDEVHILSEQEALFRPEWKVENGTAYIPTLFSKITGVHRNKNQYWKEVWKLAEDEDTIFIKRLPISEKSQYQRDYVAYWACLGRDNKIDPKKLIEHSSWEYKNLPQYIQTNIANAISDLCYKPRLISPFNKEEDLKVDIFSRLLKIEKIYLQFLQKFDYPKKVPKVVIYNNEHNGEINWYDSILLVFLNYICFDIIIYNPAGHMDIENFIQDRYFDIHRLSSIEFDLSYKEKSFINRFFS